MFLYSLTTSMPSIMGHCAPFLRPFHCARSILPTHIAKDTQTVSCPSDRTTLYGYHARGNTVSQIVSFHLPTEIYSHTVGQPAFFRRKMPIAGENVLVILPSRQITLPSTPMHSLLRQNFVSGDTMRTSDNPAGPSTLCMSP
jgi:hypothetical protein